MSRRRDPDPTGLTDRRWWGRPGHPGRGPRRGVGPAPNRWDATAAEVDPTDPTDRGRTPAGADADPFPARGPLPPDPTGSGRPRGAGAFTGGRPLRPPAMSGWRYRWRLRLQRLSTPEVLVGAAIAAGWTAAAVGQAFHSGPTLLVAVALVLWLHGGAVESGSFTLTWMTTVLVVLLAVVSLGQLPSSPPPVLWAAAATTALAHNELIRLSFARRRHADLDPAVPWGSALGVARAGALAVLGIGLAQVLSHQDGRTWLWMPVTAGVLLVAALALTLLPARRTAGGRRDRWRPGDRLPPPPLPVTRSGPEGR